MRRTDAGCWAAPNAGNVDGDGYDDVIVGAFWDDDRTGSAYVYYASSTLISVSTSSELLLSSAT